MLPGDVAFRLYDTFGVPYDFIEDTAATQDVTVDRAGFDAAMEAQRDKARAQSAFGGPKKDEEFALDRRRRPLQGVGDQFEGYTTTRVTGVAGRRRCSTSSGSRSESLATGEAGYVALAQTPFYLEAGGQVSDSGRIFNEATGASATVEGLARIRPGLPRAHRVRVDAGHACASATSSPPKSTPSVRDATRRNHTATHLLHAALRQVLGTHVKQAGSLVAPDRLRFDFVHFQPVTRDELDRIERIVNEQIVAEHAGDDRGAIDRGSDRRRARWRCSARSTATRCASSACPASAWSCAAARTSARPATSACSSIVAESGVAAGVRRIEALTGLGAVAWAQQQRAALRRLVERAARQRGPGGRGDRASCRPRPSG